MSLQLFRHYIRQRSFLPQQHLFLPIMCCCTIIYTNKPIVLEQIFSIYITDLLTLLELVNGWLFRMFYTKTKLFLPPLVLLSLNHFNTIICTVCKYTSTGWNLELSLMEGKANTQEIPRQTLISMGPSSFIQQHFTEYWTIIQTNTKFKQKTEFKS